MLKTTVFVMVALLAVGTTRAKAADQSPNRLGRNLDIDTRGGVCFRSLLFGIRRQWCFCSDEPLRAHFEPKVVWNRSL